MDVTVHVNDADTGLTYMQQRYYDPVAGRFLSTDPVLTDEDSAVHFNRYVYAENNPYKYIDPDGREPQGPGRLRSAAIFDNIAAMEMQIQARIAAEAAAVRAAQPKVIIQVKIISNATVTKSPNPDGQNGKPDHKAKVAELVDKAKSEAKQGENILENRKVQGADSNRRPDVQIVDEKGSTRKIFEAERKPNSARNIKREAEYDSLKIEHETHKVGK